MKGGRNSALHKERKEIHMAIFVYMAEDNIHAPIYSEHEKHIMIPFKVGYSKDPTRRGGQLKQAARRDNLKVEINMCIKRYTMEIPHDKVLLVEAYLLHRVRLMPSAQPLTREFFMISVADREECYKHMTQWVTEALNARPI